ncbi:hypothetical protein PAXRUDRAFT_825304 [Paxillus rubicundulus Ve08.2h10]|uniref:Uncharacterized protein n=1 Tax=Paxillus rubicundulus Ve08.2h10 TaxID=930991 RepID=A0A0D0DGK6_9AGAM|nr:hypothetical protein PAXRUDRAFT_825304 [Paxillus rubicundulus Ve08.2h10]
MAQTSNNNPANAYLSGPNVSTSNADILAKNLLQHQHNTQLQAYQDAGDSNVPLDLDMLPPNALPIPPGSGSTNVAPSSSKNLNSPIPSSSNNAYNTTLHTVIQKFISTYAQLSPDSQDYFASALQPTALAPISKPQKCS